MECQDECKSINDSQSTRILRNRNRPFTSILRKDKSFDNISNGNGKTILEDVKHKQLSSSENFPDVDYQHKQSDHPLLSPPIESSEDTIRTSISTSASTSTSTTTSTSTSASTSTATATTTPTTKLTPGVVRFQDLEDQRDSASTRFYGVDIRRESNNKGTRLRKISAYAPSTRPLEYEPTLRKISDGILCILCIA